MTSITIKIALCMTVGAGSAAVVVAQQANMAHAHIGHVLTAFKDTPKGLGLLPTAAAEAQIIAQHAALAANSTADIDAMKRHVGHVMHAIDPTLTENKGPGLGYGLKKAVAAATYHIEMAAKDKDASQNVKTHAAHVVASNTNTTRRADELIDLAQRLRNSSAVTEVAALVGQINAIAAVLIPGVDANKDGRISWELGEGGLQQAQMHMELMKKGENVP
ncbi:MAG: hypothetical protein Q7R30_16750 [Acidobacteriota bacterium]|nr:hypothetical protein [Acidobacteriota bacterium]